MQTVEVLSEPHLASVLVSALASSTKRPGVVKKLKVDPGAPPSGFGRRTHCTLQRHLWFQGGAGRATDLPTDADLPVVMSFFGSEACPWPALGTVHLANRIEQKKVCVPVTPCAWRCKPAIVCA
jgi:hypothetical protein